jgi:hypothetical protein
MQAPVGRAPPGVGHRRPRGHLPVRPPGNGLNPTPAHRRPLRHDGQAHQLGVCQPFSDGLLRGVRVRPRDRRSSPAVLSGGYRGWLSRNVHRCPTAHDRLRRPLLAADATRVPRCTPSTHVNIDTATAPPTAPGKLTTTPCVRASTGRYAASGPCSPSGPRPRSGAAVTDGGDQGPRGRCQQRPLPRRRGRRRAGGRPERGSPIGAGATRSLTEASEQADTVPTPTGTPPTTPRTTRQAAHRHTRPAP